MKILVAIVFVGIGSTAFGQSIVGKWQLSEQKTCFQAEMKEKDDAKKEDDKVSATEKELSSQMGSSSATSVAQVMTLDAKGGGEQGVIMAMGKKKTTTKNSFKYRLSGQEFQFLDKRSGLVTERWVIEELTETSLKVHDAARDCETKTYLKIK
jgi:hypothetical protein